MAERDATLKNRTAMYNDNRLKIGLFGAFFVAFPIIANQIWAFVAPGLYAKEKKAFLPFLLATPILFTAGAALAYYVVMPTAFRFFLNFEGSRGGLQLEALPGTGDYLSLAMQFIFAFGISFLLPVLLLLLNRAGIVSRKQLIGARRCAIVGIFIVAAVATPPVALKIRMKASGLAAEAAGTEGVTRSGWLAPMRSNCTACLSRNCRSSRPA